MVGLASIVESTSIDITQTIMGLDQNDWYNDVYINKYIYFYHDITVKKVI